jgi:TRAP-type C4-dicarboxylate transport system substrate-binding protein
MFPGDAFTCIRREKTSISDQIRHGGPGRKHMGQRDSKVDKELREKSGGRLGLRIYAGGIAGDELDVLKKMRIGQIQCAAFSGLGFGKILPMVRVLDLPYLFKTIRRWTWFTVNFSTSLRSSFRKRGSRFWPGRRWEM